MLPTVPPPARRAKQLDTAVLDHTRRATVEAVERHHRTYRRPPAHSGVPIDPIPAPIRAALPRWTSRPSFRTQIRVLAAQDAVRDLLRRVELSPSTFVAALDVAADLADTASGEVRADYWAIGRAIGRRPRTVAKAFHVAARFGIATMFYAARELSKDERLALVERHGRHPQRGVPNGWQLGLIPPRVRARFSTLTDDKKNAGTFITWRIGNLPPKGGLNPLTHLWTVVTRASAHALAEQDAAPPRPRRRRRRPGCALAEGIQRSQVFRMCQDVEIGRLASQLAPYEAGGWSIRDLEQVLADIARIRHHDPQRPARKPLALLKRLLQDVVPDDEQFLGTQVCEICYQAHGRARQDLPATPGLVACGPCYQDAVNPVEPCGHPECDHGWRTSTDRRGYTISAPCPDCSPRVRANDAAAPDTVDGEPAF